MFKEMMAKRKERNIRYAEEKEMKALKKQRLSSVAVNNTIEGPLHSHAGSDMDDVAISKSGTKKDFNPNKVYPSTDTDDKQGQRIGPMSESENENFGNEKRFGKALHNMKTDDPVVAPGDSQYATGNPNVMAPAPDNAQMAYLQQM